jgi:hypothetical protein
MCLQNYIQLSLQSRARCWLRVKPTSPYRTPASFKVINKKLSPPPEPRPPTACFSSLLDSKSLIGLDAQIDWQPHYFQYLFRHVYFAMAFDIIVFPQIPLVHIDRTFNFAFAGY